MIARPIGLWTAVALVVGNQIGTGVFLLPASLAPLGWNAVLGWCASIVGALALAVVFGRLAAHVPGSGGPHAYVRAAFGERAGFAVAWSYWINIWVGIAALATASVAYLTVFWPALATDRTLSTGLALGALWLFTLINLRGAGAAGLVALVTTVLKLLPLVAVAAVGLWVFGREGVAALTPAPVPVTLSGVGMAVTLTLWAFMGVEAATVPAGKIADPARTIARATLWGTALTGVVSLVCSSAAMLMLPAGQVAASNAPLADFVGTWAGGEWSAAVAVFAAISGLGCLSGWVLVQGEMPAAMARAGVFPAALGQADARGTPVVAHLLSSALASMVILLNSASSMVDLFTFVVQISVLAALVAYLASALAAIRLRAGGRAFVSVALLAAAFSAWALFGAGLRPMLWCAGLLLAGFPVYWLTRSGNPARALAPAG